MSKSELSPFSEIFPHTGSLELMLLEHMFIKAVVVLSDDERIAELDEPNADTFRFCELREYALHHPETGLIRAVLALQPKEEVISSALVHSPNNNNDH
ncbi:antirestriction protein [Xenorhabdus japonica]|uniref:antirestriction protein n=1 Tax=Xenorhabdus japonica TaxID=53341 RepID=UPI001FE07D1A|nr:antirestriction protein [Xenorhabdus japonica]